MASIASTLRFFLVASVLAACGARSGLIVPRLRTDAATDVAIDALPDVPPDVPLDLGPDVPPFDCRPDPVARCNDANACTADRCEADGNCSHAAIVCEDGDPCTSNQCDPSQGCVFPNIECGGCADGQREAFIDRTRYPNIAACSGGFQIAGLAHPTSPACGRAAGDDGPNPTGRGCTATDLCAAGFHVCVSAADVASHAVDGCRGASDAPPRTFFASRQTGPGCLQCATGTATDCTNADCRGDCAATNQTTNDIFGCGNVGSVPQGSCAPLDRSGNNLCSALPAPWQCNGAADADVRESEFVTKSGPESGGVLCCRD